MIRQEPAYFISREPDPRRILNRRWYTLYPAAAADAAAAGARVYRGSVLLDPAPLTGPADAEQRRSATVPFLVTAFPRSGTGYTAALFRAARYEVGHEQDRRDGIVSWKHAAQLDRLDFRAIVHQTRHPLRAIASATTLAETSWQYMFGVVGWPRRCNTVYWAMYAWHKWTRLCDGCASWRYRVEDMDAALWRELQTRLGLDPRPYRADVPKTENSRPHIHLTWSALHEIDDPLATRVERQARSYGYDTTEEPAP